ncbi:MAG TPA: hypothetical protein VGH19_01430 [Verrucomicrobiae bacterium]
MWKRKKTVYFWGLESLKKLAKCEFEKYSFLGDYEAIFRADQQILEAGLVYQPQRSGGNFHKLLDHQEALDGTITRKIKPFVITGSHGNKQYKATINAASESFLAICGAFNRRVTITIEGIQTQYHDDALSFLEKFTGALFFQIDALYDSALSLVKTRKHRNRRRQSPEEGTTLQFPQHEYDTAPLSLYFYARTANGLPLVQFLAFYQVLEFYFPVCYQAESRRRIRSILKDPSFRTDRDTDIARISNILSSGHTDERSMLKATLLECIDANDLRAFIESDETTQEFFKKKTKGLTDHKLPIENKTLDIRNDVAERIYDIRCRIVHTKHSAKDDSLELLLPNSPEAQLLSFDIDLLRFLAQKVLIASSSQFK